MTGTAIAEAQPRSVLIDMASKFGMEPKAFEAVVRATCMKPGRDGREATREEFAAFLLVAKEYGLNPLTKEIYAFADKGGVVPIVGVDGWSNLINSHPAFDGMSFKDTLDAKGNMVSVTCRIHRTDRSHPIEVTEYLAECRRQTEPWTKWPRRMLRHKAMIQAARYAFGFAGIYDPDEAERIREGTMRDVTPRTSTIQSRLQGPVGQGFSAGHVDEELGAAGADEGDEGGDDTSVDTVDTAGEGDVEGQGVRQEQQADDPDAETGEAPTEAYLRGRDMRRQGVSAKALPGEYRDDEQAIADWKAGWADENEAQKGAAQ